MYNIFISLGAMIADFLLLYYFGLPWWGALLVSLFVFAGTFFLIARIIMKKVTEVMNVATRDLQGQRVEKAIREMQGALKYGKWQFTVSGQINSQIGMVYFMRKEFNTAFPYLEKGFIKNWVAMGMLAVSYMKRNRNDKMKETFEKALQVSSKEPLLWNLYAYCLVETGDTSKALEILAKGLTKIPGEERIQSNIEALRDGKKMKMKSFGDMWLQFHLERPNVVMKQQAAAMGGHVKRRVVRKRG
jgi:tetratricopeptide (TPR) repeat protein